MSDSSEKQRYLENGMKVGAGVGAVTAVGLAATMATGPIGLVLWTGVFIGCIPMSAMQFGGYGVLAYKLKEKLKEL